MKLSTVLSVGLLAIRATSHPLDAIHTNDARNNDAVPIQIHSLAIAAPTPGAISTPVQLITRKDAPAPSAAALPPLQTRNESTTSTPTSTIPPTRTIISRPRPPGLATALQPPFTVHIPVPATALNTSPTAAPYFHGPKPLDPVGLPEGDKESAKVPSTADVWDPKACSIMVRGQCVRLGGPFPSVVVPGRFPGSETVAMGERVIKPTHLENDGGASGVPKME